MTEFQAKTLKNTCCNVLTVLGTCIAAILLIEFIVHCFWLAICLLAASILLYIILVLVKDWKIRGKLTEEEYTAYKFYKNNSKYFSKIIILDYINLTYGINEGKLQEILTKAGYNMGEGE